MDFSKVAACCAGMEVCGVQVGSNNTLHPLVILGWLMINSPLAELGKLTLLDIVGKEKFGALLRISIVMH